MKHKIIFNIINILSAIILVLYLNTLLGFSEAALFWFSTPELAIGFGVLYVIKGWVELTTINGDPIKQFKASKGLFYGGFGIMVLGITFRVMHWPYGHFLMILGTIMVLAAHIIPFAAPKVLPEDDADVLDNFYE